MRGQTTGRTRRFALTALIVAATGTAGQRMISLPMTTRVGVRQPRLAEAASDCSTETTLCLGGGRFLVDATWTKPDGESGPAHAVTWTADSGYFWFLDAGNVEIAVKALDGCAVNGHFWIFSAGLTNLGVRLTVTDTATNRSKTYSNVQGVPFETIADTTTFEGCPAGDAWSAVPNPEEPRETEKVASTTEAATFPGSAPGCVETDTDLCLSGRFQVRATWLTTSGDSGLAHAASLTSEAGYFWFFDPSNVELVVKALDACGIGEGQWFFAAGMTTVGVQLTVTDTLSGSIRIYFNRPGGVVAPGLPFVPVLDTSAFAFCPTPTASPAPTENPSPTPTPASQRPTTTPPRPSPRHTATPRQTPTPAPTPIPTPTALPQNSRVLLSADCFGCGVSGRACIMHFAPNTVTVAVGGTVTWTFVPNGDPFEPLDHSVTGPGFDSGVHTGTFSYSHTFNQPGSFSYSCSVGHHSPPGPPGCPPLICCTLIHHETGIVVVGP